MKKFDIYTHPDGRSEAVKQGWNWIAFLFAGIWLPYKRLWPQTYAFYFFVISPATRKWPESLEALATLIVLGMSLYFGFKGYNAVADKLKKKGFEFAATIEAETKDAALAAQLRKSQMASKRQSPAPAVTAVSTAPAPAPMPAVPEAATPSTMSAGNVAPPLPPRLATPTPPDKAPLATPPLQAAPGSKLLDLNSATEAQLAALPGVGPILAKKAISLQRQDGFRSVEHFGEMLGLKSHHVERIKPLAFTSPIQNTQQPNGSAGRVMDF